MPHKPLLGIGKVNEEVDVRHKRRAISPDEVRLLVPSARDSGKSILTFGGEQRARIYWLGKLTKRSFDFSGSPATVTVGVKASKHRN